MSKVKKKILLTEKNVLRKNVTMQFSKCLAFLQFFAPTEENKALFGCLD